jgi:hypothetical protein
MLSASISANPANQTASEWLPGVASRLASECLCFGDQMRYFVGMTVPEIADALGLSPRTVARHWAFARAWLKSTLREWLSNGETLR